MGWFPERMRGLIPGLAPARRSDDADETLLAKYAADSNAAAFAKLVERHAPMVYRVCRSVLNNDHDAEDATQATFLVLTKRAGAIRKRSSLPSWLHGVALKTAKNYRLRLIRERQRAEARPPRSSAPDAFDELSFREAREILHAELDKLPEKHKAPIVLVYLEEKSHEEAAAALGLTPTVFRGRLERARAKLAEQLAHHKLAFTATMSGAILMIQVSPSLAATVGSAGASPLVAEVAGQVAAASVSKISATMAVIGATTVVAGTTAAVVIPPMIASKPTPVAVVAPAATVPWRYHTGHVLMATEQGFSLLNPEGGAATGISPPLADGAIGRFRLAPDGQSMLFEHLAANGRFLTLWRFNEPFPGVRIGRDARAFFYSPDSSRVLMATPDPATGLRSLHLQTGLEESTPFPENQTPVDLSPDGTTLLVVIRSGDRQACQLAFADAKTARTNAVFGKMPEEAAMQWRFSPDGRSVAGLSGSESNMLRPMIVDVASRASRVIESGMSNRFFGWSPDGRALLCGWQGDDRRLERIIIHGPPVDSGPRALSTGAMPNTTPLFGRPVWVDWQR